MNSAKDIILKDLDDQIQRMKAIKEELTAMQEEFRAIETSVQMWMGGKEDENE